VGGYFKQRLEWLRRRHDCVTDVRGMGLMLGIELDSADLAKRAAAEMMAQHIIINRTSETVLRFLPPYILEREHVDTAIAALDGILHRLTSTTAAMAGQAPAGEQLHG
jgi:acetylornithine aminotransferase/acetylornithine/N-succinyldiaminopimelate aminotransferase